MFRVDSKGVIPLTACGRNPMQAERHQEVLIFRSHKSCIMNPVRYEPNFCPASTLRIPEELSIIPGHLIGHGHQEGIPWYNWWMRQQLEREPKELFSVVPDYDSQSEAQGTIAFMTIWHEVWDQMVAHGSTSIDKIITHLVDGKMLHLGISSESLCYARNLVFAIIGWQTMLYRPDMRSCLPTQIAIADETDGHRGGAHYCLRQSQSACKKPVSEFLLGFGVLLPPRNFSALASEVDRAALRDIKTVAAGSFNAYLLACVAGVTIRWMDCLACHLEYDVSSNTLYLFRYPSFCLANLPEKADSEVNTMIHACASPYRTGAQWAGRDEVSQLLQEIVLSYRLLFAQNKASRRYFRSSKPFSGIPQEGRDEVLTTLCRQKRLKVGFNVQEREIYDLSSDFPVLKSRITVLLHHLSTKRPRTWRQLWRDKRDSASWYTFWAVLIFGGMGIILALIQVILQILQVVLQIRQS
jgi:hypothetical protein